ncbi:DNA mismatch repair protein MutT [Erysipelothrix larvae]|uniref:DNA mismatch repair protein MutT n=1 Tax=Erysipelothrix larvae TaxID=1514105 RepID=A0A109UHD1_9FIRM|nr:PTS transporter subunit IIC [Erysipelothrix larvae]AMC93978.1 DNA mismatch repair protein MutT [Erysipelothrix larvae]
MNVINYIVSLGASVMMPIIFTIIGVAIGMGFGKSIKSGLSVGVGFAGLSLVTGMLTDNLGPVVAKMSELYHLQTTILDVGWPTASQIAYSSAIGGLMIPICVGVNVIMILFKMTKTMNMDIWNYWHYAFIGSIIYVATGSFGWSIFGAVSNFILTICLSDYYTPRVHKFYSNIDGLAMAFPITALYAPLAEVFNWVIDRIPIMNKIDFDSDTLQNKIGVFGEPIILGAIIGAILGFISQYELSGILKLSVQMSAVMVLIPRITGLLIEGLAPISKQTQSILEKRFKGRELWIGMSPSLVIGHPTNLVCSLLVVPFILFISVILPGNHFLPIASLAGVMYIFPFVIPIMNGNVFRTFLFGLFALILGNYVSTSLAPIFTQSALVSGSVLPEGISLISCFDYAGHPAAWFFFNFTANFNIIGVATIIILCSTSIYLNYRRINASH